MLGGHSLTTGGAVLTRSPVVTWILAFIIANVIPFFSSLLSLMSSLFDSFFGFIFWGVAYFRMRKADGVTVPAARRWLEGGLNIVRTMKRHGQPPVLVPLLPLVHLY